MIPGDEMEAVGRELLQAPICRLFGASPIFSQDVERNAVEI
jgi:hypothetical protein